MRGLSLYEISATWQQIHDLLIESSGEITEEIEALLLSVGGALEEKVNGYCSVIQSLLRSSEAAEAEALRLEKLATARRNSATRLKTRLLEQLREMGREKVETDRFRVGVQRNGRPSIVWTGDVEEIPEQLRRVRVEFDGTAAYDLYRAGQPLPEGVEVKVGYHLRIR